jgi:hypothetical protein
MTAAEGRQTGLCRTRGRERPAERTVLKSLYAEFEELFHADSETEVSGGILDVPVNSS